ncbi:MAG: lysylphosphatidylglycerol synthase domain-containing protein, partial [Candidatus Latescibacterota bacterium]
MTGAPGSDGTSRQSAGPAPTRARLLAAGRYLLAILPLAWILGTMDAALFLRACRQAAPWTVPFVVVSYYWAVWLQALRWWLTQRPTAPGLRLGTSVAYHFLAGTYSVALPSSVAQDVLRTAMVARRVGHGPGWGAAWVNRIVGLVAWLVLCLAGLALTGPDLLPGWALRGLAVSLVVLAALPLASFSKSVTRPLRALAGRLLPARPLAWLEEVRQGIYQYRTRR